MSKHALVVGRVCGWDEDVVRTYLVNVQQPEWREKLLAMAKQELWELDSNDSDDLDEDDIFINGVYISDTPIVSWEDI